mgnify:CR=1 FL=1
MLRGNVVDLAVAVIIGAAFSQIVNSVVKDIVTPVIGLIGGNHDFSGIRLGPVMIGSFINALLNFLIVGSVIFFGIVKPMKKIQELKSKKEKFEMPPAPVPEDIKLLKEILEVLKNK